MRNCCSALALSFFPSTQHVWIALRRTKNCIDHIFVVYSKTLSVTHYTASCHIWPVQYCANTLSADEFYFTQLMNTMTAEFHGSTSLISPSLDMTPSCCPISQIFISILCSQHVLGVAMDVYYEMSSPTFSTGTPRFTAHRRYCVFYKLKVSGNHASSKSIGAVFPSARTHFVFLCHILVILAIFQTFHYYYICYGDLWCHYCNSFRAPRTAPI
jgi:hypothetical protein